MFRILTTLVLFLISHPAYADAYSQFTGKTLKVNGKIPAKVVRTARIPKISKSVSHRTVPFSYSFYFSKKGNIFIGKKTKGGRVVYGGIAKNNRKKCTGWSFQRKMNGGTSYINGKICASYISKTDLIAIKMEDDLSEDAQIGHTDYFTISIKPAPNDCIPKGIRWHREFQFEALLVNEESIIAGGVQMSCRLLNGRKF